MEQENITPNLPQDTNQEEFEKAYKITNIIGLLIMLSVISYVGVGFFFHYSQPGFKGYMPELEPYIVTIKYILLAVAILLQILVLNNLTAYILSLPVSKSSHSQYSPKIQRLVNISILIFALFDIIGVFGLVLYLMGGKLGDLILFALLSMIIYYLDRPKIRDWEIWLSKIK